MNKAGSPKYILLLNIAMLCIATSGPLGKFVEMPPALVIWYRSVIGSIFLFIVARILRKQFTIAAGKDRRDLVIASVLMTVHWVTYFYALQYSNVAIGMLTLFTYPIITIFLEPLFTGKPIDKMHVLLGVVFLFGIYCLVPEFSFSNDMTLGALFGLLSALCYSIRNLMMKHHSGKYDGMVLMTFHAGIAAVLLAPTAFYYSHADLSLYWLPIVMLGIMTTGIGHSLFVSSFKHFSISRVSILSGLQPLYGILLAILFLKEIPNMQTILGGCIILGIVIIESLRKNRNNV